MAMNVTTGTFNCPSGTGDDAITGVGFQPKAILFYFTLKTADGSAVDYAIGIGMAASSTERAAISASSDDALATSNCQRTTDNADCIRFVNFATTTILEAEFKTFDADGFTLTWATVTAGVDIHYLALGGADITNAFVGTFNAKTGTGDQALTGVGFKPDVALFLQEEIAGDDSSNPHISFGMGAAVSSTKRWSNYVDSEDNATTSDTYRTQVTDKCITIRRSTSGSDRGTADFKTFDSDGLTLDWTTAATVASRIHFLALKGGQYDVGSFNQATSTGNQGVTGVGFEPKGTLFTTVNAATNASTQAENHFSLGVGISSTERRCIWSGDDDAVTTTITDQDSDQTKCFKCMTPGTPTTDTEADYVSNDADGFTIDNVTAHATSREILYLAFGAAAAGAGSGAVRLAGAGGLAGIGGLAGPSGGLAGYKDRDLPCT